ncbi:MULTISPECIES: RagB/SusD family nutrient uptake outer membrane protein [unclassified Saccharicrinis]|uniref:RagB/SusD family nutrient uptake outer membrane protein n=1 Tax=unclassified Saccharicrinis TaxID=2646859 RepID=UPI003D330175
MKYYSLLIIVTLLLSSCSEEFLDPKLSTKMTYEQMLTQPDRIEGLVTYAYTSSFPQTLDNMGGGFLDCGTDNAVINQETSSIYKISATPGYLTPNTTFLGTWNSYFENLRTIDEFFEIVTENDIVFKKSNENDNTVFTNNLYGEAYFVKAWNMAELLRRFGGVDVNGELKGVPIPEGEVNVDNVEELPRESYDKCLEYTLEAIDNALQYLPERWIAGGEYKYTNTSENFGRPTQAAALALKSRVLLYAASPAFTVGLSDDVKRQRWLDAAKAAKDAIDFVGELDDIYNSDLGEYYNNALNPELILTRMEGTATNRTREQTHFIPSLFGNGRCNPTQNLVDAFPMSDGYPAGMSPTYAYDDNFSMYQNRDPRFYATVLYNGATVTYGTSKNSTVETAVGGKDTPDGPLGLVTNTTRTGYYLRKWMSTQVDLTSGQQENDYHYAVYFRKAEMYLNFAEAMNEVVALGGQTDVEGATAVSEIAKVRDRALNLTDDSYLNSIAGDPAALRTLIRNERRIELCFEGHRFYDVRRWKETLNPTIYKIEINGSVYSRNAMYNLAYDPNKFYLPIHQNEMNRTTLITQNEGWE